MKDSMNNSVSNRLNKHFTHYMGYDIMTNSEQSKYKISGLEGEYNTLDECKLYILTELPL